jgi:CubicO group peptidase (beta-lactamase class C family)
MSRRDASVARLLALGDPGRHPAGAVLGVAGPDGREVAAGGWAALPTDEAPGAPMTADTRLDLASVTKAASTTVLVMRLVEDGALDLSDPVGSHLPAFTGEGRDGVRVEDLLTHTAGLRAWWPLYCLTTDREAAVDHVVRMPLAVRPGTQRVYSDLGMLLAGELVQRVTGSPLAQAFRALVAEPLGLSLGYGPVDPALAAASADSDVVELSMVATGRPHPVDASPTDFGGWRRGVVRGEVDDGNAAHALDGVSGHAGLFGPVGDLLALGRALTEGTLVHPDTLARFSRPSTIDPSQAVGFRLRRLPGADGRPSTWLWHGGFTGTAWGLDPRTGAVVAGGATRLHGTTGPLPDRPPTDDPLTGVATGEDIAAVVLGAAAPTPALEESA